MMLRVTNLYMYLKKIHKKRDGINVMMCSSASLTLALSTSSLALRLARCAVRSPASTRRRASSLCTDSQRFTRRILSRLSDVTRSSSAAISALSTSVTTRLLSSCASRKTRRKGGEMKPWYFLGTMDKSGFTGSQNSLAFGPMKWVPGGAGMCVAEVTV